MKKLIAATAVAAVAVMLLTGLVSTSADAAVDPPRAGASTVWPRNQRGQTYGSGLDAMSPEDEPDLIRVEATNGETGYANRTDLEAPAPASPAEAVAQQAARAGKPDIIPVYEVDGVTQIGEFVARLNGTR